MRKFSMSVVRVLLDLMIQEDVIKRQYGVLQSSDFIYLIIATSPTVTVYTFIESLCFLGQYYVPCLLIE